MPILPPPATQNYDTVNVVLNMTRVRLNDELKTLAASSGKLLDLNQAFAQQTFNNAWRKCQAFLAEKGYARLIDEVVIYGLPVVASNDPASQCWLSWAGFYDSVTLWPLLALPQGFSHPLKIWERWSNQNAQFADPPMEKFLDGMPAISKTSALRFWEWRNDAIYLVGSQIVEDLRIRHVVFLPDIVDVSNTPWWQQYVPIVRIADGLSWYICAELAKGNSDIEESCIAKAEKASMSVFNLDVRADQRVNIRRQPRSGRGYGRSGY